MRKTSKKLTGLEALDNLRDYGEWLPSLEMGIIRRELKALSIIKEKGVSMLWLSVCKTFEEYNQMLNPNIEKPLTQEEYDFLREVLL